MKEEVKQPIKKWKIIVALITLGIFAFLGYLIAEGIGVGIGIVIWIALWAALGTGKDLALIINAQKRKIAEEEAKQTKQDK